MSSVINTAGGTSRATITATVGFMAFGVAGWMLSVSHAGWYATISPAALAVLLPLSLLLAIVGILAFMEQRTLDAVIFFGGAALLWSDHTLYGSIGASGQIVGPESYVGWYAVIWAVYFFYVWLAALKADLLRMLFLLGLWLTLLALALNFWGVGRVLIEIGGYLGLITSIVAFLVSATAIRESRSA